MVVNSHPLYRLSYWGMKNDFLAQWQNYVNILFLPIIHVASQLRIRITALRLRCHPYPLMSHQAGNSFA
jgi:hypothetical protein